MERYIDRQIYILRDIQTDINTYRKVQKDRYKYEDINDQREYTNWSVRI